MGSGAADDHQFDYNYIHPDTGYSTLHWLSYWDDYESIKLILARIERDKDKLDE